MKKILAVLVIVAAGSLLGGCYYEPGYSYVRSSEGGGAYYGRGSTTVYDDGYYPGYYSPGYYGPGYGGYYDGPCCYGSGVVVGVGTTWYGGSHYRRGYRHDYPRHGGHDRGNWHGRGGHDDHRGHWNGSDRGSHHVERQPRPDRNRGGGSTHDERGRDRRHR